MIQSPSKVEFSGSDFQSRRALESLLRHLGISVTLRRDGKIDDNGLSNAVIEKMERLDEIIRRLDSTADSSVLASLAISGSALQSLSDALHADSMTGRPNLADHDSDNLLSGLEKSLEVAASGIEGINMDAVHHRDKALERFLERWSDTD
jgi:hypothetical protein